MRILLVIAHDKKDSLTWQLAEHTAQKCRIESPQAQVTILDLYAHANNIPFFQHEKKLLESSEFFIMNRDLILNTDRIALFFPVYWYSTPGIMKCWIDLITNYAWRYQGGRVAQPLHPIKKALIVSSTMSPRWYTLFLCNPAQNQVKQTLRWMGIKEMLTLEIGSTGTMNSTRMANTKCMLNRLCKRLIAQ